MYLFFCLLSNFILAKLGFKIGALKCGFSTQAG
jgi:hypothetical protein